MPWLRAAERSQAEHTDDYPSPWCGKCNAVVHTGAVREIARIVRWLGQVGAQRHRRWAGDIGAPALVQATRECYPLESFLDDRQWWLRRNDSGGGILLSGGIHDFAKLRMMLGEITLVHAFRARQRWHELETEDTVVMLLCFQNGTVGTLVESFFMFDPATATGEEIHQLRIDGDGGSIKVLGQDRIQIATPKGIREVTFSINDTFRTEVREFLDCVESRREPKTSARNQRRNLELVEAAYASIASGQPIQV